MTANQVYKLSGSNAPFSEWVGEQKNKYGAKFIDNEEFINMNGEGFIPDAAPTPEEVVMQNADENIQFPKGAAVQGSVSLGGSEVAGSASVSNFPTKRIIFVAGALIVGYWAYNKYLKK
jgi:hypothetical protein